MIVFRIYALWMVKCNKVAQVENRSLPRRGNMVERRRSTMTWQLALVDVRSSDVLCLPGSYHCFSVGNWLPDYFWSECTATICMTRTSQQRFTVLTLKVLNFWKFTSYCCLKPLWSGMGEVVPPRTSPTLHPPFPPTVHQLSWLSLSELNASQISTEQWFWCGKCGCLPICAHMNSWKKIRLAVSNHQTICPLGTLYLILWCATLGTSDVVRDTECP